MCCLVASPQPDDLSDIDFYVDHFDTQMTEKYSTAICSGGMCCLLASTQAAFLQPAVAPRPPSHPPTHRPLSLYKRPLPNCDPLSPARNHSSTSIGVKRKCQRVSPVVFHSCHTLKSDTLVRVSPRNTLPSLFELHLWSRLVTQRVSI